MAIHILRRANQLGDSFVLSPERFDPRRKVEIESKRCLVDLVDIITDNVTPQSDFNGRSVLVLDTTHAYEGFVICRHDPISPTEIGSTKRRILAGDIIISRLRPYLRQIAYIDQDLFRLDASDNEVVASTEFFILRGRNGFDATSLVPFLLSDTIQKALSAGQEGGHHPRFSKDLLGSLRIPDCLVAESPTTARQVKELASGIRKSLMGCRNLVAALQDQLTDSLTEFQG